MWARQQYTGIEGRTWGMDNCNFGYSELGPFEMLCWTPPADPGGPGQAGMDCDLERALHQVDPSYPLSELCGYVADPPCNPDNPYGYCYDPCHLNPSLCYFPPTCDETDPNSSCYNPPPSCDPNDPSCNPDACPPGMQDCHYPPCDPSDPYGGCYVDPGECNSRNPNCDPPPACDPNDPSCS